jgi:opacity protein-like surface antigen
MKRAFMMGALLAAALPGAALAELHYSTFEARLLTDIDVETSGADVNGDGFAIAGSYEMGDKLFLFGEWQDQSFDFGIDGTGLEIGLGYKHEIKPDFDFVGTLSLVDQELEVGGFSADDDGLALGGGIRTKLAESFELDAMLRYVDMDEGGSDTGFRLGGRWYFKDTLAVSFGLDTNDNADTMHVGFRAEF